ncbi:MAG: NupC/NupG family nucleoside CNT transporter [Candidatus Hydrogenedentales bacterium]|jgi:CNT family concentrative nucleoside transporter
MILRLVSFCGLWIMVFLAWALSEQRREAPWRLVLWGVGLQFAIGAVLLPTRLKGFAFAGAGKLTRVLTDASLEGAGFVFGDLARNPSYGALVAFQVLPVIILVSAVSGVLYHFHVIQAVVRAVSWLMRRTLKTSGAETLGTALLILLGIESMTAIRQYINGMTRSELCTVMTAFMATIAGSVMVVYAGFGAEPGHLLTASLMSAPAAIVVSKIMVPEREQPATAGHLRVALPIESQNLVDAAARGASQGLALALNVGAMLIAFLGLMYMADLLFGTLTGSTFKEVMGWFFRPFALAMGAPPADAAVLGQLLGTKTILNEFLAYLDLQNAKQLSSRGHMIATYALCGFANPGSLGILIAGMTSIAPERRNDIVQLGFRSFAGGTLACFMTACVAGVLLYA